MPFPIHCDSAEAFHSYLCSWSFPKHYLLYSHCCGDISFFPTYPHVFSAPTRVEQPSPLLFQQLLTNEDKLSGGVVGFAGQCLQLHLQLDFFLRGYVNLFLRRFRLVFQSCGIKKARLIFWRNYRAENSIPGHSAEIIKCSKEELYYSIWDIWQ